VDRRVWIYVKSRIPAALRARLRAVLRMPGPHVEHHRAELDRRALLISHSQISGFDLVLVPGQPHRPNAALDSAFYDRQHEDAEYRQNNWLLDQLTLLKAIQPRTVVEIGCGNGRFLRAVAPYVASVVGVDWAQSPELLDLPANVTVLRLDVVAAPIPCGDLICSADVLEHFAPRDLDQVISKLARAGPYQHHVIACYDDGHTHLSLVPPVGWLALFRKHCPTAYLADVHYRRNDPTQIVCIISNLPTD
jgi:SAM-dependent methyltransferase